MLSVLLRIASKAEIFINWMDLDDFNKRNNVDHPFLGYDMAPSQVDSY